MASSPAWVAVRLRIETSHAIGSRRPALASEQAAELSSDDAMQHLAVETAIRHQLLPSSVLVLELLQSHHLARQQPRIPLLPVEIHRLADPSPPADSRNQQAVLTLPQDERLLRVRDLLSFHRPSLPSQLGCRRENSRPNRCKFRGSDHPAKSDVACRR